MPNARRFPATVVELTNHGYGVFSVWLRIDQSKAAFKPGQFLHLALDAFDPAEGYWPESRVFSIASPPGSDILRIVYAVKGSFTERMSRELVVGKPVWLKLPFGEFIVNMEGAVENVILIAGGTGITPFVSLFSSTKWDLKMVWLYYGVRRAELLLFREELKNASVHQGLNLNINVEESSETTLGGVLVRNGTLDISEICASHGRNSSHYYLSGPPGMIFSFRSYLESDGVPVRNIHVDDWQ